MQDNPGALATSCFPASLWAAALSQVTVEPSVTQRLSLTERAFGRQRWEMQLPQPPVRTQDQNEVLGIVCFKVETLAPAGVVFWCRETKWNQSRATLRLGARIWAWALSSRSTHFPSPVGLRSSGPAAGRCGYFCNNNLCVQFIYNLMWTLLISIT